MLDRTNLPSKNVNKPIEHQVFLGLFTLFSVSLSLLAEAKGNYYTQMPDI